MEHFCWGLGPKSPRVQLGVVGDDGGQRCPGLRRRGAAGRDGRVCLRFGRAASFTTPSKLKLTASSHVRTAINGDVYTITQMRA